MKLYGTVGRVLSIISLVAAQISAGLLALQAQGVFAGLSPKVLTAVAGIISVCSFIMSLSERIQGGASKPEVRAAAAASDRDF